MLGFTTSAGLPTRTRKWSRATSPRMQDASSVVDKYFPPYEKHRAPLIKFNGEKGISVAMPRVEAFTEVDKNAEPLFNYDADDVFKPNKAVPPSPISWPGGDGRGNPMSGTKGSFTQPNVKEYGPFPDFYKRSCDG